MTEQEWLSSEDPTEMLLWVTPDCDCVVLLSLTTSPVASDRKLRLFVAAVEREWLPSHATQGGMDSIRAMEAFADGVHPASSIDFSFSLTGIPSSDAKECVRIPNLTDHPSKWASILRDILGNPFRLVVIDPAWVTPDVRSLALAAYGERLKNGTLDPDRLAILSDALEEAGCDDEVILNHLRSLGQHYRGCYVLDEVLGKS